jgi:hypothetical protein
VGGKSIEGAIKMVAIATMAIKANHTLGLCSIAKFNSGTEWLSNQDD